jgi:hypothetical protein
VYREAETNFLNKVYGSFHFKNSTAEVPAFVGMFSQDLDAVTLPLRNVCLARCHSLDLPSDCWEWLESIPA